MKAFKSICTILATITLCQAASAQKTYNVVALKGESLVKISGEWTPLRLNMKLDETAILKNTGEPEAEVCVREAGTPDCYNIFVLKNEFNFKDFINADTKGERRSNTSSFSYFIKTGLSISRSPNVKITRTNSAATHRNSEQPFTCNTIIHSIAAKTGGIFLIDSLSSVISDYAIEINRDGEHLSAYNFSDKTLYAIIFNISKDQYGDNCITFLHDEDMYIILEPYSIKEIEYNPESDRECRTVLFASENILDPLSLKDDILNADGSDTAGDEIVPVGIASAR